MTKAGRNAPCPCGSGRKYKNCCLPKELGTVRLTLPPVRPSLSIPQTLQTALALHQQGHLQDAEALYRQVLALDPTQPDALHLLGIMADQQGNHAAAVELIGQAISRNPLAAHFHSNLGLALLALGRLPDAITAFQQAIQLKPDYPEAHSNLGVGLQEQGKVTAALASFREALRLQPDLADAHDNLLYQAQNLCDWSELSQRWQQAVELIRTSSGVLRPLTSLAIPTSSGEQLTCARTWVATKLAPAIQARDQLHFTFVPRAKERLRIGYLSTDFHPHPVAYLMTELFELHDREQVEVFAYSIGNDDDSPVRHRILQSVDHFVDLRDLSRTDSGAAARRIYDDGIDILVDLNGYTQGCRTEILALRPAPIQVSYLGYPGTMGAPFIDYLLTDAFLTPPDAQPFFDETFVYLPNCYQVNPRQRPVAAETPSREEVGLPADGFVFCCFNNAYKLTPELFTIWMRLLQQVPGSVLWLSQANQWVVANLQREAAARGIDPGRLIFAAKRPLPEYLVLYRLADLFLDTLPYNAGATASDALWMGLPVLTCPGQTYVSRMAGSLLTALGLPQLITASLEGYEELALQLAQHPSELAALREQLRLNRDTSPLFDTPRFTQNLEAAYRQMWEDLVSQQTRLAG
jgi:protein O-GlcNAc transferase